MNLRSLSTIACFFAWPLLLLAADGLVRARVVLAFGWVEWSYYLASVALMLGAYCAVAWGLRRLHPRWPYRSALALVAICSLTMVAFGYGAYRANGDLPDLFLLSYIRCEPENAMILFKDSFKLYYLLPLLLAIAGLCLLLDRSLRLAPALPLRGLRRRVLAAGLCYAAMWYCWGGTAGRGQCFVPLVRIPAVVAMYGYNEWKGINPRPIELPPRQPKSIPGKFPRSPVNVLLILNESLRRQNLAIYGHPRDTTPCMTRFAAEHPGKFFKFNRAYANSTTTLLSVPSILTGISPLQPIQYRIEAPLLWQWAGAADMETFLFTSHDLSWCHIGRFITTPGPDTHWDQTVDRLPHYRDLGCDDHFTVDRAVRHLKAAANSSRPFMGVVHLNTNHYPYNTRREYQRWSGAEVDLYDNTILETDTHTGRLIDTLKTIGKLENTVIIFASDHGEAFNEHGYIAHFYCHFTETVSVPLWLYLPPALLQTRDLADLGNNLDATVQNLDILPTIADCIGAWDHPLAAAPRQAMMGQSLLRPLSPGRTVWITNTDESIHSVIGLSSITDDQHYMIRTSSMPAKEDLYDLTADPAERNNLWETLSDARRDEIRRAFLRFPVAAGMMRAALPQLAPEPAPHPR